MLSAGKMLQKSQNAKQQNVCQRNKKQRSQKIKNYISIYSKKKSCDKLCKMQMPSICYQFLEYILVNITVICCTRDCF